MVNDNFNTRNGQIDGLRKKANQHFNNHEYEDALDLYEKALQVAPKNVVCLDSKGSALCALYRHDEALEAFERSISLNDQRYYPYQGKAQALYGLEKRTESLAAFDEAFLRSMSYERKEDLQKAQAEVLVGKAYVLSSLSEHEKALEIVESALLLKNDLSSAWCAKGDFLCRLNRDDEAFSCYEKAESIDSQNASVFNGRGHIYLKQVDVYLEENLEVNDIGHIMSKLNLAESQFDKSLSLKPKYAESLCGKGSCLTLKMQIDSNKLTELENQALEYFDQALKLKPEYPEALKHRAQIVRRKKSEDFDAQFGDEWRIISDGEFEKHDMHKIGSQLVGSSRIIENGSIDSVGSDSFFVHQKQNKQWVTMCVTSENKKPVVLFKDSKGSRIPLELETAFKSILGPSTIFKSHCIKEQTRDGISGPMALNNMKIMADGIKSTDYAKYFLGSKFTNEDQVSSLREKYQALANPDFIDKMQSYVADLGKNGKFVAALRKNMEEANKISAILSSAHQFIEANRIPREFTTPDEELDHFKKLYSLRPTTTLNKDADEIKSRSDKLEKERNKFPDEFFKLQRAFEAITRMKSDSKADAALKTISSQLGLDYDLLKSFYQEQREPESKMDEDSSFFLKAKEASHVKVNSGGIASNGNTENGIKKTQQLMRELVLGSGEGKTSKKSELEAALNAAKSLCQSWEERSQHEVSSWAKSAKVNGISSIVEAIAVMNRANNIITGGHNLRETQIIAILTFLDTTPGQGRLCEIKTGEGKTTIVSCLAAIKALQGKTVDIITSNPVLAQEGVDEKEDFYSLLGLSVATNNSDEKYTTGAKKCYTADILYGSISNFQFDFLRDSFDGLGTRAGRVFDTVILDEVDSMLIDNGGHIAKISGPLPGMESLKYIYIRIWNALASLLEAEKNSSSLYDLKEKLKGKVGDLSEEKALLSSHLLQFCEFRIDKWLDLALHAVFECRENEQYVIRKKDNEDFIIPVDYANTGITMKNTIWSHGLHQFVQLKHNLQLTAESLTSNFISNLGFICKYNNNIFGLTGTLGSVAEQQLLSSVYNVDYAKISTFKEKIFEEQPGIVADDDNWANTVVVDVLYQTDAGRAALVVCETIKDLNLVKEKIESIKHLAGSIKIRVYADEDNSKETKEKLEPGHIVLSTNIAGRGTDFKTSSEVEKAGGLYVCVGFLPCNKRVEDQAFGRTSRQGNNGSAKLIIRNTELDGINTESDFKSIKAVRDKIEAQRIEDIKNIKVADLAFQDALFSKFTDLYRTLSDASEHDDSLNKFALDDLKEAWAFWLEKQKYTEKGSTKPQAEAFANQEFQEFMSTVKIDDLRKGKIVFNPYYAIRKADFHIVRDQKDEAKKSLENALALGANNTDVLFSANTKLFELSIQSGDVLKKRFKKALAKIFGASNSNIDDKYKTDSVKHLENANKGIQKEINYITKNIFGSNDASKSKKKEAEPAGSEQTTDSLSAKDSTPSGSQPSTDNSSGSSSSSGETKPFVKHLQSRYQCLNAFGTNLKTMNEELSKSNNKEHFVLKSKVRDFLKTIMNDSDESQAELKKAILAAEATKFSSIGMSKCYQLKIVHDIKDHTVDGVRAQILSGVAILAVGMVFPMASTACLAAASTLISEGICDIVTALINQGDSEDELKEYLKGKAISYGTSALTFGIGALASSIKFLNFMTKCTQNMAKLFSKSPMMSKICQAVQAELKIMIKAAKDLPKFVSKGQMLRETAKSVAMSALTTTADQLVINPIINKLLENIKPSIKSKAKSILKGKSGLTRMEHLKTAEIFEDVSSILDGNYGLEILQEIATGVSRHYSQKYTAALETGILIAQVGMYVERFCVELNNKLNDHQANAALKNELNPIFENIAEQIAEKIMGMISGFVSKYVNTGNLSSLGHTKSNKHEKDEPSTATEANNLKSKPLKPVSSLEVPIYEKTLHKIINQPPNSDNKVRNKNAVDRMSALCGKAGLSHLLDDPNPKIPNRRINMQDLQQALHQNIPGVKFDHLSNVKVDGIHETLHQSMNKAEFDVGMIAYDRHGNSDGHFIAVRREVDSSGKPVLYGVDSDGKRIHDIESYLSKDNTNNVTILQPTRNGGQLPNDIKTGFDRDAKFGAKLAPKEPKDNPENPKSTDALDDTSDRPDLSRKKNDSDDVWLYRVMQDSLAEIAVQDGKIPLSFMNKGDKSETWFSTTPEHSLEYLAQKKLEALNPNAKSHGVDFELVQIGVNKPAFEHMVEKQTIDQKGSGSVNDERLKNNEPQFNVINREKLDDRPGEFNFGVKNPNMPDFNENIVNSDKIRIVDSKKIEDVVLGKTGESLSDVVGDKKVDPHRAPGLTDVLRTSFENLHEASKDPENFDFKKAADRVVKTRRERSASARPNHLKGTESSKIPKPRTKSGQPHTRRSRRTSTSN